jgi:hypothetical protein
MCRLRLPPVPRPGPFRHLRFPISPSLRIAKSSGPAREAVSTLPGYNRRSLVQVVHSIPVLRSTRSIRTSACFIWGERHRAVSVVGG